MRAALYRGLFVSLSVLGAATWAGAQPWTDQGSVKSKEYKKEIRGDSGVEATEFFTLEYSVAIQIEEVGRNLKFLKCSNICRGQKHKEHKDCDFSCDDKCAEEPHKITIKGRYDPNTAAMGEATAAANGLAIQGGGTVSPNDWSHRVSQALAEFRNGTKKKVTHRMPHLENPCGAKVWEVGSIVKAFRVQGTMKKVGYRMSRGMRTPINETVGTHQQEVATGTFPQDEPFEKTEKTICLCKQKEEVEPVKDLFDLFFPSGPGLTPQEEEEFQWGFSDANGLQCYDSMGNFLYSAKVDCSVVGEDMNTVKLLLTNNAGQTVRVVLPPGVMFIPSDAAVQKMASLQRSEVLIEAGRTQILFASIQPQPVDFLTAEISSRWACLELAKKEPHPGVKFRMKPNRDDVLNALGAITARSRFRGPHDQARVWIYTDKASRDEINKKMLPGVAPGTYLTLLRDVGERAGVDLSAPAYAKCLEPELLNAVVFDDRALRWVVGLMADVKPKELATYVSGHAAEIAQLTEKDGKDGAGYVGWLAGALCLEENSDLRKAGSKLLIAVPQSQRAAVASSGGLAGLRWLLISGKEDQCALAMDVIEAYGSEEGRQLAMASWEAMPSDALRARAEKLVGAAGN